MLFETWSFREKLASCDSAKEFIKKCKLKELFFEIFGCNIKSVTTQFYDDYNDEEIICMCLEKMDGFYMVDINERFVIGRVPRFMIYRIDIKRFKEHLESSFGKGIFTRKFDMHIIAEII